jgi:hypothetical protein
MEACVIGTLTYAPVREFSFISASLRYDFISDEVTNNLQSINLKSALVAIYNYWKTDLLLVSAFQCPMGVVTEISQNILSDSNPSAGSGLFQIETKLKVNWLTIASKSIYA